MTEISACSLLVEVSPIVANHSYESATKLLQRDEQFFKFGKGVLGMSSAHQFQQYVVTNRSLQIKSDNLC